MTARSTRTFRVDQGRAAAFAAALLLAVCVAMPAQAQRLSLAQRVTRLEQAQQQNGKGNNQGVVLVNQVQALQQQVQQLQGQVEELQHRLKQMQQTSKDQYIDLDSRVRRLEGGGAASAASGSSASAPAKAASAAKRAVTASPVQGASAPAASASTAANPQAAQDAYSQAFTALRNGQFVQSARQFRTFIQQYPDSPLTPNAYYWLGESYYTVQNYEVALETFQHLVQQFPDSDKTAGAMLKAGYCQDALNKEGEAQKTLQAVVTKYPGSSVAQLAQQRLKDIALRQAN